MLVSTFQELYGAPFLTMHPGFKGKIYMTLPLMQIGQNLLIELVRLNEKRNQQKAQKMNFLEEGQMFQEFSMIGLEDWQELYTEKEVNDFFANHVIVLNHNERHTFDSIVKLTPVSSGFHIGSSCWLLEVGHLKLSVITNASMGLDFRHPKKLAVEMLQNADVLLLSSIASKADQAPYF